MRLAKGKPPAITDIPNVPEREIVFDGQRYEDRGPGGHRQLSGAEI